MSQPTEGRGLRAAESDGVRTLVASAASLMGDALTAWTENNNANVGLMAPMAVELLGKAVLWRTSPALLVQLSDNAEPSLLILTTKPDLANPQLRTIGLEKVMVRLEKLLGALPVDKEQRKAMVEVRNGAIHVGYGDVSRGVLLDALALCRVLLQELGEDPGAFYGEHRRNAQDLLEVKRTEVGDKVAAKKARARRHMRDLEEKLGELFEETTLRLEEQAEFTIDPLDFDHDFWAVNHRCPECGSDGRLMGRVEVFSDVEFLTEVLGEGDYTHSGESVSTYEVTMFPQEFACNVCRLNLHGVAELIEEGLPAARLEVSPSALGDGFDLSLHGNF